MKIALASIVLSAYLFKFLAFPKREEKKDNPFGYIWLDYGSFARLVAALAVRVRVSAIMMAMLYFI